MNAKAEGAQTVRQTQMKPTQTKKEGRKEGKKEGRVARNTTCHREQLEEEESKEKVEQVCCPSFTAR